MTTSAPPVGLPATQTIAVTAAATKKPRKARKEPFAGQTLPPG